MRMRCNRAYASRCYVLVDCELLVFSSPARATEISTESQRREMKIKGKEYNEHPQRRGIMAVEALREIRAAEEEIRKKIEAAREEAERIIKEAEQEAARIMEAAKEEEKRVMQEIMEQKLKEGREEEESILKGAEEEVKRLKEEASSKMATAVDVALKMLLGIS
ncbi:MAG TPA: hypothetical protein ENF26_02345 [Methanomicrobia archaeon]|nr:hypothetical protein [Methanomicrobia archaeon]HEX58971.1 hypothetical protein [Methanomicrobia archaeon]